MNSNLRKTIKKKGYPKGRKAVEKLQKSPVLRKKTKKSRKMRENEFIEKHVTTCKPGKIKHPVSNRCVLINGAKGREALKLLGSRS